MSHRRVAVIGAGTAGLATTSYLLAEGLRVTLFEERSEAGGVWTNTDTSIHPNPIYDGLETNVPRTLMTFTDHPWPTQALMFPPNQAVKEYLKSYYEKVKNMPQAHDALKCEFGTNVLKLQRGLDNYQWKWKIEANAADGVMHPWSFDAVVVAAALGREAPVSVRNPDQAVITGYPNSAVGTIIKYDVSTCTVSFKCGTTMSNVDYVIYCTGYFYNFPFAVKNEEPLLQPRFKVANIYKHIFYTREPSLAFVGLLKMTAAFTVAEAQSAVVARAFSGGLNMPIKSTMEEWERTFSLAHLQQMRADNTYHTLAQAGNENRKYVNDLQAYATSEHLRPGYSKPPPYWCRCLDNARALSGNIRTEYKKRSKESKSAGELAQYASYTSLGSRLQIPCMPTMRQEHRQRDAVVCFLDPASR